MKSQEQKYIQKLIDQGEHSQLDFKFEINNARKIAITLVAFANTYGGRLLIGVKDNGKISGIKSDEEYYMIESAAAFFCNPAIKFESQNFNVEGKTILEIYIPPSENRPHFAKDENDRWLAYHRVKDQNYLANRILLDLWKYEKRKKGTLIEFTRNEDLLLNYLNLNKDVSLTKIIRDTGFKRDKLIDLLVKLIAFDIVKMIFREKGAIFRLNDTPGGE